MATLKEFEDALKAAGNTEALDILEGLRARDRGLRSIRPARRLTGRKMTPELATEIRHLHQTTNMTQQEIAFQLGVNQGRVNEVIKRGKWLDGDPDAPEAQARDKAKQRAKDGVGIAPRAARKTAERKTGTAPAAKPQPEPPVPSPPAGDFAMAADTPAAAKPTRKPTGKSTEKHKPAKPSEPPAQLLFKGL